MCCGNALCHVLWGRADSGRVLPTVCVSPSLPFSPLRSAGPGRRYFYPIVLPIACVCVIPAPEALSDPA